MATKPTKKRVRLYGVQSQSRDGGKYQRPKSDERYHTWRWTKESRAFREDHPLCVLCLEKGLFVPSEVVDHIVPVAVCKDFWDQSNWQALCKKCNAIKGNKDKKLIKKGRSYER